MDKWLQYLQMLCSNSGHPASSNLHLKPLIYPLRTPGNVISQPLPPSSPLFVERLYIMLFHNSRLPHGTVSLPNLCSALLSQLSCSRSHSTTSAFSLYFQNHLSSNQLPVLRHCCSRLQYLRPTSSPILNTRKSLTTPDLVCQKARIVVHDPTATTAASESSFGRSVNRRPNHPVAPSRAGSSGTGTTDLRARNAGVDVMQIQKVLEKNPELADVVSYGFFFSVWGREVLPRGCIGPGGRLRCIRGREPERGISGRMRLGLPELGDREVVHERSGTCGSWRCPTMMNHSTRGTESERESLWTAVWREGETCRDSASDGEQDPVAGDGLGRDDL